MQKILKSFLKKLTNLSGSNRSLLLLRLTEEQDLDLNELDFLNGAPSYQLIEKLIAGRTSKLCSLVDSRNERVTKISRKLKLIDRREKFIFEERGSKDLYVGWPFVKGKLVDGSAIHCPLLFFPVSLTVEDTQWVLSLREDVAISLNKSFFLAYSHYNAVPISDDFLDTSLESFSDDSQIFRTELYTLLKNSPVDINFNQELFINKLVPFENYRKADFTEKHADGELKLLSEAVLGIFPQSDSYLVPDYDFLLKDTKAEDLEDFFIQRTSQDQTTTSSIKEEHTITPLSIDASQEKAIHFVKLGKSLVVQGPPGTGKSQMICNLISDYIARGKNVLLVCQKRSALDVVYDRLKKLELHDFVGLVHDFKNDRKQIYHQINKQIEKLDEYKFKNNSLDAIYLERTFVQTSRRIEQITEELDEFKNALFSEVDCGMSVKELYLSSDLSAEQIDLKQEFKYFKSADITSFSRKLNDLIPYAAKFEKQDFLWNDRVSFVGLTVANKKEILRLLDHIPFYQTELSGRINELLNTALELEEIEWIHDRREQVGELLELLEDSKTYSNFGHLLTKNTSSDWLSIQEKKVLECFKGAGIEESLPNESLGQLHNALESASNARTNIFKWLKWSFFSKDKYLLKRVFASNKLKWNKNAIDEMMQRVDNRLNFEHNLTELKECGWLQNIPEERKFDLFAEWFHYQHTALSAKAVSKELRGVVGYVFTPSLGYNEFKLKLNALLAIVKDVPGEKRKWLQFLTPRQISKILSGYEYAIELADVIKIDFESLVEYDRLGSQLSSIENAVLAKLLQSAQIKTEEVGAVFENSVKLEWIEFMESKYPVLRSVASLKMEQLEKELQECVEQKEKLSSEILLMNVREKTYRDVEYNRLDNRVTYRELQHQVTKKKMLWPIRKLLSSHAEEVFN